jgi:CPA1 family monovalent cation:H+ antiporter
VDHVEVVLAALFVAVAGLTTLARRLAVPYPILLVPGGLALGFVPGIPTVELDPELVFAIFLPPLLYHAAFFADLRSLRADARSISLTSVGLVLVTMAAVATLAHEVIGVPWAVAFALGAIVSPTDPVAATAVMRRLGAPRRIVHLVEGESLINDAAALVAFRVAVAAAVGGSFSVLDASLRFVWASLGGVVVGLVVGFLVAEIRRRLDDPPIEITISLFTGYAAFFAADELGLSAVLATVTAGIFLGWRGPEISSPAQRLQGSAFWEMLVFLLNATLFVLVGLQLPVILDAVSARPAVELAGYAVLVSAVVIGVRFAWMFTMPYVIRAVDRRPSQVARRVGGRSRIVIGWSGMRGAVSLAAALAVPLETAAGAPFPERDLILFVTFTVILVTVVGQGLTLPGLIRRLDLVEEDDGEEGEELRARLEATRAALERLDELADEDWTRDETVERIRRLYEFRKRRFAARAGKIEDHGYDERSLAYQRLMRDVIEAQRAAILQMRNEGLISAEVMRRVERDLDLEESRLET